MGAGRTRALQNGRAVAISPPELLRHRQAGLGLPNSPSTADPYLASTSDLTVLTEVLFLQSARLLMDLS